MKKQTLIAGGAAAALVVGLAGAPLLVGRDADARQIVVQAPQGAPMSFADLIEKVSPAVVSISARGGGRSLEEQLEGIPPGFFEEFFRRFPERRPQQMSLGSGFFISADGIVVTNNHVVDGATEIMVRTSEEEEYEATVVGADPGTDIAVLRIKDSKGPFPFVAFDTDPQLRVGDWVVAVGNPFGLEGTATAGIVSAFGRENNEVNYVDFLQIDAPINRGNSGGPTFDLRGRVVGVNSAILSPTGGNVGIGFAIPADTAAATVDQILKTGKVTRGWLGVSVQPIDDDIAASLGLKKDQGALVVQVVEGGPAQAAGVVQGDVILQVNGDTIKDSRDLTRKIGATSVGSTARLLLLRDGQRRTLSVKLAERNEEQVLAGLTPQPGAKSGAGASANVQSQGRLGLEFRPLTADDRRRLEKGPGDSGLIITSLETGSPLARKALRPGDLIVRAGGRDIRSKADLDAAVEEAAKANRPILLQVERNGQSLYVAAELMAEG